MVEQTKSEAMQVLFRRALNGDRASLDQLLAGYGGYLNLLARAQLDKRIQHRVSPSDIVQETLLEAHRDFGDFRGEQIDQFTRWLRRVLVHNISHAVGIHVLAAKRSIRREQPFGELSAEVDKAHQRLSAFISTPRRSPASEVEHQESLVELAMALEQLPAQYRDVIVLRHLDGLAFDEVADRLKRSPGATRMLWLRAIEHLRQAMENMHE